MRAARNGIAISFDDGCGLADKIKATTTMKQMHSAPEPGKRLSAISLASRQGSAVTTVTSPIVFLHIPKTAGQTIHNALVAAVGGGKQVSPIRVHTQSADQYPEGYRLYSGHLDWDHIYKAGPDRFSFTVLRDPAERIASFYFYLQKEARKLSASDLRKNIGKRRALEWSADDYFFGGDNKWQAFILDHYNNFYCSYFSTRMMRGHARIAHLKPSELIGSAQSGLESLQGVYLGSDAGGGRILR